MRREALSLDRLGFTPVDITGYDVAGIDRYTAVFEQPEGPARSLTIGQRQREFKAELAARTRAGFVPVRLIGYGVGGTPYFATIWEHRSDVKCSVYIHQTADGVQQNELDLRDENPEYRIVDLSGYAVGGRARFASVLHTSPSDGWAYRVDLTQEALTDPFVTLPDFRLVHLSAYGLGGIPYYAAIWEKSAASPPEVSTVLDRPSLTAQIDDRRYRGFRPARLSGFALRGDDRYATVWAREGISDLDEQSLQSEVGKFMDQAGIPGLSIAVAKDGRLVYARGFGMADQEAGEAVTVRSRFRIASASKSVTAVAIMRLIEQGKLELDGRVFGQRKGLLGRDYGSVFPYPERVRQVTVRHLLTHTSGGWGNDNPAPDGLTLEEQREWREWTLMFGPAYDGMDQATLLGEVLDHSGEPGHPCELRSDPGEVFGYSGFGYFVLGRIIEKVTGKPYDQFVREEILDPASAMTIAGNTRDERQDHEVVYYSEQQPPFDAYSLDVRRSDSSGGWIASAIDLVGFMTKVDGEPNRPDIFDDDSYRKQMITESPQSTAADFPYGKGWLLDKFPQYYGAGFMAGTHSAMFRAKRDGSIYCFAGIVNTSNHFSDLAQRERPDVPDEVTDARPWLVRFVDSVSSWPCIDLF